MHRSVGLGHTLILTSADTFATVPCTEWEVIFKLSVLNTAPNLDVHSRSCSIYPCCYHVVFWKSHPMTSCRKSRCARNSFVSTDPSIRDANFRCFRSSPYAMLFLVESTPGFSISRGSLPGSCRAQLPENIAPGAVPLMCRSSTAPTHQSCCCWGYLVDSVNSGHSIRLRQVFETGIRDFGISG